MTSAAFCHAERLIPDRLSYRFSKLVGKSVTVGVGVGFGSGSCDVVGTGEGIGDNVTVGEAEGFGRTALFQINFLPDLIHINLAPWYFLVKPIDAQAAPLLGGAAE